MKIPIWQVDAFTDRVFAGNPAAVCLLEQWLADSVMAKIAAENNLAETGFVCREEGGGWRIRWFTPEVEVDLCGHATLAAAFVLFSEGLAGPGAVAFQSLSGELKVFERGGNLVLDFPARPPVRLEAHPEIAEALGASPLEVWKARDLIVLLESEDQVRKLKPDLARVGGMDVFAICVTAAGQREGVDFVSRFFAPRQGIPEDPVTGSAHCSLAPFWALRLGRNELKAEQVSSRGGRLSCLWRDGRVEIGGRAALFLRGEIYPPSA